MVFKNPDYTYYSGQITADLKDWVFHRNRYGGYYWGDVYNDVKERWPDGRRIHTSQVVKTEERNDCIIVITLNSVYRLWREDAKNEGAHNIQRFSKD